MAGLSISLLGPPRVERDGEQISVDTRKAIALLAFLAISPGPHRRDSLAALLWPEHDREHARGALRRTLSTLKKAIGEEWLEISREAVGLRRAEGLEIDVEEFRRHQDVELFRGDFMAGFSLRDSVEFDDWQQFAGDSMRRELAAALDRLVEAHAARGEYGPAIAQARRWLELDPLHEPAHRQLIRLYALTGERAAALNQYRECVRILTRELGVPPLEETTELYEEISEGRVPSAATTGDGGPRATRLPELPLVGRARELGALVATYEEIGADGRLLVLEGEAGIGKTRLAQELLAHAESRGAVTAAARSHEDERALAYGPFVELLRALVPTGREGLTQLPAPWLAEAGRLVPEVAELQPKLSEPPPLDNPGARSRFFEGVGRALFAAGSGTQPPLLLLDDLHWADEASIDLLAYLVRRLEGRPLCMLVTWRSEEVGRGDRLRRMLAEGERSKTALGLTLARLGKPDVAELVGSLGASGALDWLYRETEGLPFFVAEYLAVMLEAGVGEIPEGDLPLPGGARELLHARLAPLGETSAQVLTTAAVIGGSFDLDTVRRVAGRGEEETVSALEELVAHALVEELEQPDGAPPAYHFGHERLRDLVYEETTLARRRLLHRRVAESLGAGRPRSERGAIAGLAAHHLRLAGLEREAADQFVLAGEHARSLYANEEALSHFQAALALGHPDAGLLHERCGDLLTLLGDYPAALASYEAAAAHGDDSTLPAIEHKLAAVHHRRGDWELAESHFTAALQGADPARRARVEADRSLTAHRRGESERAAELAGKALRLAEAADDPHALAQAHNILGVLASRGGEVDESRRHLEQSLELAEALPEPSARIAALNNIALATGGEEALALMQKALEMCTSQGDRHLQAALHNNLADLLHAAGRQDEAMSHLKRAVAIFAEIGEPDERRPEIWKLAEW